MEPKDQWTRSSFCDSSNCVEVNVPMKGTIMVRHSGDRSKVLVFTDAEWRDFVKGAQANEFTV